MIILQLLSLLIWLVLIPTIVGLIPASIVDGAGKYKLLPVVIGYLCMWALFQCISVPLILAQSIFDHFHAMSKVAWIFGGGMLILAIFCLNFLQKNKNNLSLYKQPALRKKSKKERILWGIFFLLLLLQVLAMIFLAFGDGDDAYYMAVSAIAEESDELYLKLPYTGGTQELDTRYGLAPMPVWIAFLARVTGFHTATLGHIFVPVALLLVTYGIYGMLGQFLCKEKEDMLPVYMIGISLFVMFGNYSFKTAETFLLTRTSQGKSILGNIIFPFLFLLFFFLIEKMESQKTAPAFVWVLFMATAAAGCLCSTMGGVLVVMLMGIVGFFIAVCYKSFEVFLHLIGSCLPALLCIVLYLLL